MSRSARLLALLVSLTTLAFVGVLGVNAASAAPPRTGGSIASTVSGTATDAVGATVGTVSGTFTPSSFAVQNGRLTSTGTLTATVTDAAGAVVGTATSTVTAPVQIAQATGSCQILHLVLGPLDLNLLGLMIHLDRVVLDITAQQGPGNLLGNLLCAIAGLLNGPANIPLLTQIANLLNRILGLLG